MTGTLPYDPRSYLWNYRTDAVTPWFFRRKVTHAYGGIRRLNEHGVVEHEHDSTRLRGFPGLFTDTSEHTRVLLVTFSFFTILQFSVPCARFS